VDDVTGGVYEKMMSMLRMTSSDRECVLINGTVPGRLLSALNGEDVICTTAKGGIQ
jgi:isopentenyl phosphate kinase